MNTYTNQAEQHPAAEILLLAIEGELQENEALSVADHLISCWKCRTESEEMRKGIFAFMEYRNAALPDMIPPPCSWRRFRPRLEEATRSGHRSFPAFHFRRIHSPWGSWRDILRPLREVGSVPALLAAAVVFVVLALIPVISKKSLPSAQDVLSQARASRSIAVGHFRNPVIIQEMQIQSGDQVVVREVHYRTDQVAFAATTRDSVRGGDLRSLQRLKEIFANHGIPWDAPLDILSFSDRNSAIAGGANETTQVRTNAGFVTLMVQSSRGQVITESSVKLRMADWHPVERHWRFADGAEVEIRELSYEIRDDASPYSAETVGISRATARPTESLLLRSEVMARAALHGIGADLGDPIDLYRTMSGSIRVQGIATSEQRREELMSALKGIPYLQVRLQMLSSERPRKATQHLDSLEGLPGGSTPLLAERLAQSIPDQADRREFINHILQASQESLVRAWALRKLAERYTPSELKRLDDDSLRTIRGLLADHIVNLRRQLTLEKDALNRVVGYAPAQQKVIDDPRQMAWQGSVLQLFSDVSKLDASSTAALVGTRGAPVNDVGTADNLMQACQNVEADIERVNRDIAILPSEMVRK